MCFSGFLVFSVLMMLWPDGFSWEPRPSEYEQMTTGRRGSCPSPDLIPSEGKGALPPTLRPAP